MTFIDPRQRLLAALRTEAATVRDKARPQKPSGPSDAARAAASQLLADRVRALDPEDPGRRDKAVRLFLEAEFAREFGASLAIDPAYAHLVDAVCVQMRTDPEVAHAMDSLGDLLLTGALP